MASKMKAIGVSERGDTSKLTTKQVPKPAAPTSHDLLVQIKAISVNPIDIKVRGGVYDDFPDYFDHVPKPFQIIGFDAAGVVVEAGPSVSNLRPGDDVYYAGSPVRQGSNAEYQLVDARSVARKPANLSFAEAAALPLTYITAYEALVERLGISKDENASLLIVNGAGGVGAVATQIAKKLLKLPVVITTASRPETRRFSTDMGTTHIVNHREDIVAQVKDLDLDLSYIGPHPLKYVFITHSTTPYLHPSAALRVPFGKVCSIVQTKEMDKMYGSEFMAKSLAFVWALIGTKPYYGVELESHGKILEELRGLVESGTVKSHLTKTLPLTLKGLREAHELVESGKSVGKVVCNVAEVPNGEEAFV